jgi:hypothetical protein
MSETTGWSRCKSPQGKFSGYKKKIGHHHWKCVRDDGRWLLCAVNDFLAVRDTLRECQKLAHATARLWEGDKVK